MKSLLLIILMFVSVTARASEQPQLKCARELLTHTESFIAYMGALLDERLIGERELTKFVQTLESGSITNPISESQKQTVLELHEPYHEIKKRLQSSDLSREAILKWAIKRLATEKQSKKSRDEAQKETKDLHQKMIFNPIKKGSFKMGKVGKEVAVTLTHDYEMMSTLVTQKMWLEVMGENPSHFRGSLDLPVESITFWSALVFLNRLSEKRGLKPVYDLSMIQWKKDTKAEDGSLVPVGIIEDSGQSNVTEEKRINTLFNQSHPNIYQTEGYRLPTEAEFEFVMKNRGRSNTLYFSSNDETEVDEYAWHQANADGVTHPVASKNPNKVDGYEFYDLFGLVLEMTWDIHPISTDDLIGGVDPQGPPSGAHRVMKGSHIAYSADAMDVSSRTNISSTTRWQVLGFRVARTLRGK